MKSNYTLKSDGFRAVWFEGNRDKAVIYMGGAKCDEQTIVKASEYLRKEGFSVLCLGFYYWDGMPKEMYGIPVEYAEKAVAELKRNGYEKIAIHGVSTGAGYALLCASLIPDIGCTIAVSPYDYIMEGMKNDIVPLGKAVYSYKGQSLPYSRYTCLDNGLIKAFGKFMRIKKEKEYRLSQIMRYAYDTSEESEQSRIKVENMRSDLLIIAPDRDGCWPSEQAVPRMERILKENNYPYRVKAVVYEKASHLLGSDASDMLKKSAVRAALGAMLPTEKMYPRECDAARRDSMSQIIEFLKEW